MSVRIHGFEVSAVYWPAYEITECGGRGNEAMLEEKVKI